MATKETIEVIDVRFMLLSPRDELVVTASRPYPSALTGQSTMHIIDALLVTPLLEEFRALMKVFGRARRHIGAQDEMVYWLWRLGRYQLSGAPIGGMGLAGAAAYTADAIREWNPANIFLTGIAGGIDPPSRLPLGDVVVPDQVIGYQVASISPNQHRFRPTSNQPGFLLQKRAEAFWLSEEAQEEWKRECFESQDALALRESGRLERPPEIHFRPVASGNNVVKSRAFAAGLKDSLHEKICAVEMEAQGAFEALYRRSDTTKMLMVRGISDYADEDKEQLDAETSGFWRSYAAGNAARLVRALLLEHYVPVISKPVEIRLNHNRAPAADFHSHGLLRGGEPQYLHFPAFLQRKESGTTRLHVAVEASHQGLAVRPSVQVCVLSSIKGQESLKPHPDGHFIIPAMDQAYDAGLFLVFDDSASEVVVTVSDVFGQSESQAWRPPNGV